MSLNELPSVLIYTLLCFIENNPQDELLKSQEKSKSLSDTPALASLSVVSDIMTDILVYFVTKPMILSKLIEQDLLFLLITTIISRGKTAYYDDQSFAWE